MTPEKIADAIVDDILYEGWHGLRARERIAYAIRAAYEDAARIAEGTDWHMARAHTPVEILIANQIAAAIRARYT
jgi:hypothetical protein